MLEKCTVLIKIFIFVVEYVIIWWMHIFFIIWFVLLMSHWW